MKHLGAIALAIGLFAALLSATIWGSFLGSPLGVIGLLLAAVAIVRARKRGETFKLAGVALVASALAVAALPVLLVACNNGVSCV